MAHHDRMPSSTSRMSLNCRLVSNWKLSRSVVLDGADDEEDETDDRCGAEGEDLAGSVAGAGDCSRSGAALSGASEPGLCLEEAAAGARCACVRPEGRAGGRGADRA